MSIPGYVLTIFSVANTLFPAKVIEKVVAVKHIRERQFVPCDQVFP